MPAPSARLLTALVSCAMIVLSANAQAQARGAPLNRGQEQAQEPARAEEVLDEAGRARKVADMDAWLRRLPGRYLVTGDVRMAQQRSSAVRGEVRCTQIGEGPGVQCMINATWKHLPDAPASPATINFYDTMQPALMLFGLDPKTPAVQLLYTNDRGLGTGFTSRISDARRPDQMGALRWGPCWTQFYCFVGIAITARPGSDVATMQLSTPYGSIALIMRRQPGSGQP